MFSVGFEAHMRVELVQVLFFFSRLVHCLLPFVSNFDLLCFVLCAVREELMKFKDALQIGDGDDSDDSDDSGGVVGIASRLFVVCIVAFLHIWILLSQLYIFNLLFSKRSDDKNFIKGRRSELVLASCLYYACRFGFLFYRFSSYIFFF